MGGGGGSGRCGRKWLLQAGEGPIEKQWQGRLPSHEACNRSINAAVRVPHLLSASVGADSSSLLKKSSSSSAGRRR